MTYEQQLAQINATIEAKRKELGLIMTKAVQSGRTPNDEEEVQIKGLESDIERLELNAARLQTLSKNLNGAKNPTQVKGDTP